MINGDLKTGYQNFVRYPANILIPVLLFVLLAPGLFLTLESSSNSLLDYSPGVLMSGVVNSLEGFLNLTLAPPSMNSVLVHGAVLGLVLFLLRAKFPQFY